MEAGDAAGEMVCGIEERGVGVGDFHGASHQIVRDGLAANRGAVTFGVQLDRPVRPDRPMAEQAAHDAALDPFSIHGETERREEVQHDVVVVASIKGYVVAAGFRNCANHIEGLVTIERRDFDGDNLLNLSKASPEGMRQHAPAHRGLQVEAEEREHFCNSSAVVQQLLLARFPKRPEAEQAGMEPEFAGERSFSERLFCLTADPGNPQFRSSRRQEALF